MCWHLVRRPIWTWFVQRKWLNQLAISCSSGIESKIELLAFEGIGSSGGRLLSFLLTLRFWRFNWIPNFRDVCTSQVPRSRTLQDGEFPYDKQSEAYRFSGTCYFVCCTFTVLRPSYISIWPLVFCWFGEAIGDSLCAKFGELHSEAKVCWAVHC